MRRWLGLFTLAIAGFASAVRFSPTNVSTNNQIMSGKPGFQEQARAWLLFGLAGTFFVLRLLNEKFAALN